VTSSSADPSLLRPITHAAHSHTHAVTAITDNNACPLPYAAA
jgi:hypothetical protein